MRSISSNAARQTFGQVLVTAQREPVLIRKNNHPSVVIMSVAEYDRLKVKRMGRPQKKSDSREILDPIAKKLPVVPILPGKTRGTLTVEEMIELVKSAELDDDA